MPVESREFDQNMYEKAVLLHDEARFGNWSKMPATISSTRPLTTAEWLGLDWSDAWPGEHWFASAEIPRGFKLTVTDHQHHWTFDRAGYEAAKAGIEASGVSFSVQDNDLWSV